MNIGNRIQQLRKEHHLSQEKFAEGLGISRQAVAKWEKGITYPDLDKILEISNTFHISLDSLLKDEEACAYNYRGKRDVSMQPLLEFLCRAKRATYASKGPESISSRPKSHDLQYSEDEYLYIDSYLGGLEFAGEEALWQSKEPLWAMNYVGRVLDEKFSGDFLKDALMHVNMDMVYRGPEIYIKGDYIYQCEVQGEFHWFAGNEHIFYKNTKVYECKFHGGSIK